MLTEYETAKEISLMKQSAEDFIEPDETETEKSTNEKPEEELFFWSEPGVCG